MSVAVVTVAVGETYQRFLPEWATAVSQLHSQPDEVVIVGDRIPGKVREQIDQLLIDWTWIQGKRPWKHHPQVLANDAIRLTGSDWICKMDVDDVILPHALDPLDSLDCDVLMFGMSINALKHFLVPPMTGKEILDSPVNRIFAGSPFRRWVWEASEGFQDMLYDDWRFWREAARNAARFAPSGTIDYVYRLADHNATNGCQHETEKAKVMTDVHEQLDTRTHP